MANTAYVSDKRQLNELGNKMYECVVTKNTGKYIIKNKLIAVTIAVDPH